jgi:hypothetical protein
VIIDDMRSLMAAAESAAAIGCAFELISDGVASTPLNSGA